MLRYSRVARALALPALLLWPLAAACGGDDEDDNTPNAAGTTSSGAGGRGGTTSRGGAAQGGMTAEGGASDAGASSGGAAGEEAGGAGGARPSGGSNAGGEGGAGGAGVSERRVFVSSQTFAGATLGGLSGADDECQALADAEDLGGIWLAWLSDGEAQGSPSERFVQSPLPYVRIDGLEVAADWADLTDGSLDEAIDVDETGTDIDALGNVTVWTGTNPDGTQYAGNCSNWSTDGGGFWGTATATDATWTATSGQGCTSEAHLYCFEQ